jgi:hypothetical protein
MDATQRLIEELVERRMQNTGESQAVATANVMAAFEKLKKKRPNLKRIVEHRLRLAMPVAAALQLTEP